MNKRRKEKGYEEKEEKRSGRRGRIRCQYRQLYFCKIMASCSCSSLHELYVQQECIRTGSLGKSV